MPEIKQMIAELEAAGWIPILRKEVWKSPSGKLYGNQFVAWQVMVTESEPDGRSKCATKFPRTTPRLRPYLKDDD